MNALLKREYPIKCKEISIDCCGLSFLTICGKHINGGFASIVNFGLSYELSSSSNDVKYNAQKISETLCTLKNGWLPSSKAKRIEISIALSEVITKVISELYTEINFHQQPLK